MLVGDLAIVLLGMTQSLPTKAIMAFHINDVIPVYFLVLVPLNFPSHLRVMQVRIANQ